MSLRQLNVEAIDLYYLHRVDPNVPLADQVGELEKMRQEGKIKCLGLSKVDILQLTQAITIAGDTQITTSVTVGYAWSQQGDTVAAILERADMNMYRNKRAGKAKR